MVKKRKERKGVPLNKKTGRLMTHRREKTLGPKHANLNLEETNEEIEKVRNERHDRKQRRKKFG